MHVLLLGDKYDEDSADMFRLFNRNIDTIRWNFGDAYNALTARRFLSFDIIISPYRFHLLDLAFARRSAKHKPLLILHTGASECISHLVEGGICDQVNPRDLFEQFRDRERLYDAIENLHDHATVRISKLAFTEFVAYLSTAGSHKRVPDWLSSNSAYSKAKEIYARMTRYSLESRGLMLARPIFGAKKDDGPSRTPRVCFVIMPFTVELTRLYTDVVRPAIESLDIQISRGDDLFQVGSIVSQVWDSINEADFLIADLTGRNPNVYYELGMAQTLGRPAILMTQRMEDVPFDVRHQRIIEYGLSFHEVPKLKTDLIAAIETLRATWPIMPAILDGLDEELTD